VLARRAHGRGHARQAQANAVAGGARTAQIVPAPSTNVNAPRVLSTIAARRCRDQREEDAGCAVRNEGR